MVEVGPAPSDPESSTNYIVCMHLHMIRSRPNKTSKMQIFRNTFYAVLISKNVFTLEPKAGKRTRQMGLKMEFMVQDFNLTVGFTYFHIQCDM